MCPVASAIVQLGATTARTLVKGGNGQVGMVLVLVELLGRRESAPSCSAWRSMLDAVAGLAPLRFQIAGPPVG